MLMTLLNCDPTSMTSSDSNRKRPSLAGKWRRAKEASAARLIRKLEDVTNRPDSGLSFPSEEAHSPKDRLTVENEDEEAESSGYSHDTKYEIAHGTQ